MNAAAPDTASRDRFAKYDRIGALVATFDAPALGPLRVYEMLAAELELKFVAVPADSARRELAFFTLEGLRDHARAQCWREAKAA